MKKLLLIAVLMLALVLTVAACKTEPTTNETTAGETTAAPAPAETTAEPADETTAAAPEETTVAPVETTEAPVETTEAPAPETTEEPEPETTADPMLPVNVFEADALASLTGMNGVASAEVVDGVLHVVPSSPDPYWYPFAGVDGARYIVVRYKTDATGADVQLYIGSSGSAPTDDSSMLRVPATADGEWHLAIFDTQSLIDAGIYNGSYVSYFRFDPLEAGYMLDENGQPYKPDGLNYARYELPADCSIDVDYVGFFHSVEAAQAYDAAPALLVGADELASKATGGNQMSAELMDGFVRLTATGADPYFQFVSGAGVMPQYLAFAYRTNASIDGQIFIGSGAGPNAQGDNPLVDWDGNGMWNLKVIDLANTEGLTSITDGNINYLRLDFFGGQGEEGDYYDLAYVGFFDSVADAETYNAIFGLQVKDATNLFQSNASAYAADTDLRDSDLAGYFDIAYGANDPHKIVDLNGVLTYNVGGFNAGSALPNGKYALVVKDLGTSAPGFSGIFVRALRNANPEKQFYGQDGNDAAGTSYAGSGIFIALEGEELRINIKSYVDGAYVPNVYKIFATSNQITVADDGANVYILTGDKVAAIITISGTHDYGIGGVAADEASATATLTLCDGSTHVVENAILAAACNVSNSVGFGTRGHGNMTFSEIAVKAFSAVEIPEMEIVLPAENIALGKPITSDNIENDTNIPTNANDGDDVTRFGALPTGEVKLILDLEAVYALDSLKIAFENASCEYEICVSVDGETYTQIYADANHGATTKRIGDLNGIEARYIMFHRLPTAAEGSFWFSIYEMAVYAVAEAEEPAEELVIDMATLGGTGYRADFAAAGYSTPLQLLGYGVAIELGEVDLSKYSAVKITYGCDGGEGTAANFEAASSLAIGLKSENSSYGQAGDDNFSGDIAHTDMVFSSMGWAGGAREAVVDLTEVDYNGNVWVAVHNPAGTEIAISAIVFVP